MVQRGEAGRYENGCAVLGNTEGGGEVHYVVPITVVSRNSTRRNKLLFQFFCWPNRLGGLFAAAHGEGRKESNASKKPVRSERLRRVGDDRVWVFGLRGERTTQRWKKIYRNGGEGEGKKEVKGGIG